MGQRGPVGASRAEQEAKGVRPNRLRQEAVKGPSLGPPPEHYSDKERARWAYVQTNMPQISEDHQLLAQIFVQAWTDWSVSDMGTHKERSDRRKEVVDLLGKMGALPGRALPTSGDTVGGATKAAMDAFN